MKGITCSEKASRTARAKWRWLGLTSHRRPILWTNQVVTGIQGGKLSTAMKIQFLQAPAASFVCELFSFFRQLRTQFWHHWLVWLVFKFYLSLQFSLIVELLFSNMHPSITIYFNSPIHTFLCINDSFRWFHILHRPILMPRKSKVIGGRGYRGPPD